MRTRKVYFDNAATTPLRPEVLEKMLQSYRNSFGNPSSIHSFGREARVAIEETRELIADFISAKPGEIYFVSGGTEANNYPIFGIAQEDFSERNRARIIYSAAEHQAVLEPIEELETYGFVPQKIKLNKDASISESDLISGLSSDVSLSSVIHINNETGTVNDIKKLSNFFKDKNVFFHSDAVQSFGKVKIDVNELGVDSLSFCAHKIGGPKGIGAFYLRSGVPLRPIIYGGSQERNRRGGTENVQAIIGFAEAIKAAERNMDADFLRVQELRKKLKEGIVRLDSKGVEINEAVNQSPYVLNVALKSEVYNNDSEAILMFLDINGVAASNGAACSSGTLKPSHVILGMGKSIDDAKGAIRFSFGAQNTLEEVEYVLEVFERLLQKFKK